MDLHQNQNIKKFLNDTHLNEMDIMLAVLRGSHCHGLATSTSDEDYAYVYATSLPELLSLRDKYVPQCSDEKNDNIAWEIGRFAELLIKGNPSMLEMLFVPDNCILKMSPLFKKYFYDNRNMFLTKEVIRSLYHYAQSQINKAQGYNKKCVNPIEKRKDLLDYCHVIFNQGSKPVKEWLSENGYSQEKCGLVHINNMKDMYGIYYDSTGTLGFHGLLRDNSQQLCLSSVPKGMEPVAIANYNLDGYKLHIKQYNDYQNWLKCRNEDRFSSNNGYNFDAKNMCECIRLLKMAKETVEKGQFIVDRTNIDREYLLDIKSHEFSYEEIMKTANELVSYIEEHLNNCALPDTLNDDFVNQLLLNFRKDLYGYLYGFA